MNTSLRGMSRLILPALSLLLCCSAQAAERCIAYVGTYTGAKSKGIYAYELDRASGELKPLGLAAEVKSPSFLAIHPNKKFLYAISEIDTFDGKKAGGVSAYSIDAESGKLTLLNQQTSGGPGPCHVAVDKSGKVVLVANYGGGSIESIPLLADGKLGDVGTFIQHQGKSADASRQEGPHAHSVNISPDNHYVVAADLGLDKLLVYQLDTSKGTLTPNDPPYATVKAGSGPRHFSFHPNGRYGYLINEMACTITGFTWDEKKGILKEIETVSTLPGPVEKGFSTAEVQVHPKGKFLYGSNRGHNSIAVYEIARNGTLRQVEIQPTQGKTPRNFGIDPTGQWLLAANQDSDNIVVFKIDPKTGKLQSTGKTVEVGMPVCVEFLVTGKR
ncbi:MAG: pgl 1 [Verrucomicrobiales bacterium]|nr:pgl 1 [Verrucomicrobiales bacterium]